MNWIDASLPLSEFTPPYPGDPGLRVEPLLDYARGAALRLSAISLSAHLGTHVDAPLHFIRGGASIDQIALDRLVGPACVVEVLTEQGIGAQQLDSFLPFPYERVLIKTSKTAKFTRRPSAWLKPDAARLFVENGVRLVGIDSLSVDTTNTADAVAHKILLGAGLVIVENLVLHAIPAGSVDMVCLPLNLVGLEGAPARVILKKRTT